MAGITLVQAEAKLSEYMAAETAVLSGQSYEIAGRSLRRADLAEIRNGMDYWDRKLKELSARASGRGRVCNVRPGG
ncbi:MAG TPA: DUF6148 family protein [Methylophilaceae bacterium]|nr:DUF6148 family protein [Methylophilaceae bacterium]